MWETGLDFTSVLFDRYTFAFGANVYIRTARILALPSPDISDS